jgi:hypothetical protein
MCRAFLASEAEAKIVTDVDDHSRYCVIAAVVARATGRAVCLAFAAALRAFGVPGEVLTDIQAVRGPVRQGRGRCCSTGSAGITASSTG